MNTAFIFAAGRGSRLRPLTDRIPKALCTVGERALIDYHLEKLNQHPSITRVLINHAYLGDQIRRHVQKKNYANLEIIYIAEPPGGLCTGGSLVYARNKLGNAAFLAINADVFTDYDFSRIKLPETRLAHLVLIKTPADHMPSDFGITRTQQLSNSDKQYTFAGIACYHPQLFEHQPLGRASIAPWLRDATNADLATAEVHSGMWFDTGSPARLERARAAALQST
ncbi:MAG: nucleotidyltransferase family protein [Legionella sp.]|jgi:MurNAc alpha-1-phosphate uridylyltransferase|nr:nucleotidyltransferase family protein [Legionella sp.]